MTELRIACVHSNSEKATQSFADLSGRYEFVPPEQSEVIVALGGDGLMLHTIHNSLQLDKPIFGMNCGTVGFLMNDFHSRIGGRTRGSVKHRNPAVRPRSLPGRTGDCRAICILEEGGKPMQPTKADALVFFGATGDLAFI